MARQVVKSRLDTYIERQMKNPIFASSVHEAGAEVELQCAVAEVLNRVARHRSGDGYDKNFYETLSRKCGVSPRSLRRFLEDGYDVRKAAKILYPLGYRISRISIKKLSK